MSVLRFLYDVPFARFGRGTSKLRARTREGRTGFWLVIAFCFALAAPGVAAAHEAASGEGHAEQDSVALMDAATESRLADGTVARSSADATAAAAAVVGNEGEVGQWGPLTDWPVVGIHVALFSNGKVLAWDASNLNDQSYTKTTDHTFTRATVFDPATGTQTAAWVSGHNIFCAGLAHLTDGTLFTAGGNADQFSNGIVNTYTFSPASNAWTLGADMQYPRWYPSVTPLTNGEMLITGGRPWLPEARRRTAASERCPKRGWTCRSTPGWTSRPMAASSTQVPTTTSASWIRPGPEHGRASVRAAMGRTETTGATPSMTWARSSSPVAARRRARRARSI